MVNMIEVELQEEIEYLKKVISLMDNTIKEMTKTARETNDKTGSEYNDMYSRLLPISQATEKDSLNLTIAKAKYDTAWQISKAIHKINFDFENRRQKI